MKVFEGELLFNSLANILLDFMQTLFVINCQRARRAKTRAWRGSIQHHRADARVESREKKSRPRCKVI